MKFVQIDKTKENIFSNTNEDLHLIKCVKTPSKKALDGRTLSGFTSFKTKSIRKMTLEEIEEAILDNSVVLIRIEDSE